MSSYLIICCFVVIRYLPYGFACRFIMLLFLEEESVAALVHGTRAASAPQTCGGVCRAGCSNGRQMGKGERQRYSVIIGWLTCDM